MSFLSIVFGLIKCITRVYLICSCYFKLGELHLLKDLPLDDLTKAEFVL